MCQLPYADDIAHPYIEQDPASAPEVKMDKDVLNFLESIDVGSKNCKIKVPLAPHMMVSPSSLAIIDKVIEKIVGGIIFLSFFILTRSIFYVVFYL